MSIPPPGYDDSNVIPVKRLESFVDKFEKEITLIQKIYREHGPQEALTTQSEMEKDFEFFRKTAGELGADQVARVEHFIETYQQFKADPDQGKLDHLFEDLERLKAFFHG